jgi:hypothetical protein
MAVFFRFHAANLLVSHQKSGLTHDELLEQRKDPSRDAASTIARFGNK